MNTIYGIYHIIYNYFEFENKRDELIKEINELDTHTKTNISNIFRKSRNKSNKII